MITISHFLFAIAEALRLCGVLFRDLFGDPEVSELVLLGGICLFFGYIRVGLVFWISHFGSSWLCNNLD